MMNRCRELEERTMERHLYYNSWVSDYKYPFGAIHYKSEVDFAIRVEDFNVKDVSLVMRKDYGSAYKVDLFLTDDGLFYKGSTDFKEGPGLYFYYFKIESDQGTFYYGNNQEAKGGEGQVYRQKNQVQDYQLTAFRQEDPNPAWYQEGIVYQIFVDRFDNGNEDGRIDSPKPNSVIYTQDTPIPHYVKDEEGTILYWDFYGGNLRGVIKRLPYLKKMGISILYLNPIFEAHSNHKYDTGDYFKIDPMFGGDRAFEELLQACQEYGIKIILDGVFNHTGADSKYFNKFGNYDSLGAYQSKESPYYDWYFFTDHPDDYEGWWGDLNLPRLNTEKKEVQDFLYGQEESVVPYWIRKGIAGWRIDVADELTDSFLQGLRQSMDQVNPDTVLIGEVWEDASNKISYNNRREYIHGGILHGAMNYPLRENILDLLNGDITSQESVKQIFHIKENYPQSAFYNNFNMIGSHDTVRVMTALNRQVEKVYLAYLFLFLTPGVPSIYYGDEVGLEGEEDPDNRRPLPWEKEDKEIRELIISLAEFRKKHPECVRGEFIPFSSNHIVGIIRYSNDESWTVALINPSSESAELSHDDLFDPSDFGIQEYLAEHMIEDISLEAYSFKIFTSQEEEIYL